jgi:hypothetical protein
MQNDLEVSQEELIEIARIDSEKLINFLSRIGSPNENYPGRSSIDLEQVNALFGQDWTSDSNGGDNRFINRVTDITIEYSNNQDPLDPDAVVIIAKRIQEHVNFLYYNILGYSPRIRHQGKKITALEKEIADYKRSYDAAVAEGNDLKQITLLETITAASKDLTELRVEKGRQNQPAGRKLFTTHCSSLILSFHIEILSRSHYEMSCEAQVIFGDLRITLPIIVDSCCQEELTLERADIEALNLPQVGTRNVQYPDGSSGNVTVYEAVTVELSLSDGSIVQTSVVPVSLQQIGDHVGVECTERLLGYPSLDKLNLKLDFRGKKLVKRIRRI